MPRCESERGIQRALAMILFFLCNDNAEELIAKKEERGYSRKSAFNPNKI